MPLAAALLKTQLDSIASIREKLETKFIDFYMDDNAESVSDKISKELPDLVGFSTYLWNRKIVIEIATLIRENLPEVILFAGGAEATAIPEKLLHEAPFDFIIKGEGELVLTEVMYKFLRKEEFKDTAGVCLKNNLNNDQWPVADLEMIPSPFLSGELDPDNYSGVLWELSRGCPFKCSFCFESRGVSGVRQFSLERIQKELEFFEMKRVNQVFVLDPTFNRDSKRAKHILKMIIKIAPLIHFTFEVRTEFLDSEMAELFSGINCSLQIGLQSAIPDVLSNVNRKIDTDKYADKISLLNSAGVIFGLDLIYGLPGDTLDGFKYSLDYALNLQPNHLDIFPLAVLPGTALYDTADSFSLRYLKDAPYTLISSPGFTEENMSEAESLKKACNIFYNTGGAAGWMFMILETLDIDPSEFLKGFSQFIDTKNIKDEPSRNEIVSLQKTFVRELFEKHKKPGLYPVMEDIISFHGALNMSLHNGPYTGEIRSSFREDSKINISPGTMLLELKYNFDDLMSIGEFNLEEFLANFRPVKTYVIIYNCTGEVKPLIIDKKLFEAVKTFRGEYSLKEILLKNRFINKKELYEFVEYAIGETIIHIV